MTAVSERQEWSLFYLYIWICQAVTVCWYLHKQDHVQFLVIYVNYGMFFRKMNFCSFRLKALMLEFSVQFCTVISSVDSNYSYTCTSLKDVSLADNPDLTEVFLFCLKPRVGQNTLCNLHLLPGIFTFQYLPSWFVQLCFFCFLFKSEMACHNSGSDFCVWNDYW